ncbi:putative negative regulator of transcription [Podospora australis]|uniref:Negative regulator of transcription n=1 Tax=Podospora australis TaxID=1536484 RepID=A0AAN6WZB0_9PEZI|nr:putative negative regulator of transcription [Podospora australis]
MAPQDTYFDDDDDTCPLCIEDFDLSDRNFRPCPCGYQICQFCFNNIRTNMNGLCPACRRPYNEATIEYKVVTPEEYAEFRANVAKSQKKRAAEQRQKEAQKREAENHSRKNLVGVRVVQKNLVYVTGLQPTVKEEELLKTLRKPEFFGQYGSIQKISISNRRGTDGHNQSLGVYVTFEKQEDAHKCIQAVNGSMNGDRVLRAQLGTTKYCSAWLRHEVCSNRQCMFLHELAEEEDSYTRQDLSSINGINAQKPIHGPGPSRSASRQQSHPSPAPTVAQPMVRSSSKDGSDNGDAPALPPSANWARSQVRSRRGSHATSGAAPSPAISNALPVTAESAVEDAVADTPAPGPSRQAPPAPQASAPTPAPAPAPTPAPAKSKPAKTPVAKAKSKPQDALQSLLKALNGCSLAFPKLPGDQPQDPLKFAPAFDPLGGVRRRALREAEDASSAGDQQPASIREPSEGEPESSGSLALGGEPEDRDLARDNHGFDHRRAAQPPIQRGSGDGFFGQAVGSGLSTSTGNLGSAGAGSRTMTPQQHPFMRPPYDHLPSSLFQGQGQGHNRQGSRFSFANDNRDAATSSTSVKLAANPRIMAQQSSMMPSTFHNQPGSQYYASSMPGPPPGLKSTGTPPGMFGQHGFGSGAFGVAQKENDNIMQLINRNRGAGAQAHDAGKLDLADPSILQARMQSQQQQHLQQQSGAGLGQGVFGGQSQDDELPSLEEFTPSVDALVADEPIDINIRQPPGGFESFGRVGTPSLPPGLHIPSVYPSPVVSHSSFQTQGMGLQTPPGTTLKPIAKPTTSAASSPLIGKKVLTPSTAEANKKMIKTMAAESGLSKDIAKSSKSQKVLQLQDEDFPALNSPKPQPAVLSVASPKPTAKGTPAPKKTAAERAADRAEKLAEKAEKAEKKATEKAAEKAEKAAERTEKAKEKNKGKEKEKERNVVVTVPTPARASTPASTPAHATATSPTKAEATKPAPQTTEKSSSAPPDKKLDKRPVPGILNIAAATKVSSIRNIDTHSSATEKSATDKDSAFPALPTPTPVSVSSPMTRTGPKTLRLVSTPKTEVPPPVLGHASSVLGPSARVAASSSVRPETPVSEMISDNASIISASISASRASSPPPPSKIGSAPVRTTTKSQQRKQRKEVLKKESAVIAAQPVKVEPEVEIGPIIGRKKKQKKEKEKPATARASTPAATNSESPSTPQAPPAKEEKESKEMKETKEVKEVQEESSTYRSTANETTTLTGEPPMSNRYGERNSKSSDGSHASDPSSSSIPRTVPSPAAIFQSLLEDHELYDDDPEKMAFFRPSSTQTDKWRNEIHHNGLWELTAKNGMTPTKNIITEEDQATLHTGKPIHKIVDGIRIMITANGDCVRNLAPQEEERYIKLQERIAEAASSPAAFVSSRHEAGSGFSLIKGRAVPNGTPSYFPQVPGAYPSDPVNKIQREEAIYYINQYVLPRLNLNSRDMSFPTAMSNWTATTTASEGTAFQTAAANLHSMAPWLYSGVNGTGSGHGGSGASGSSPHDVDAAAPELSYPGPVGAFADSPTSHNGPRGSGDSLASYLELPTIPGLHPADTDPSHVSARCGNGGAAGMGASSGPFGNVPLMSVEEAEQALAAARKEFDKVEKSFNQYVKKNRRLLLSSLNAITAVDGIALVAMAVTIARVLRGLSMVSEAGFAAVWMAVVLVEGLVSLVVRWGVFVVEGVCEMLDWVGADF